MIRAFVIVCGRRLRRWCRTVNYCGERPPKLWESALFGSLVVVFFMVVIEALGRFWFYWCGGPC